MREAVICEPLRTPVGRFGGVFRDISVQQLASTVLKELLTKTAIPAHAIDDVLLGQGYPNAEAPALGRVAALDAGLPITSPGLQIDRRCGSGLQAVLYGAMEVQTGVADIVIAGGAESMSQTEYYTTSMRWGARAENVAFFDRLARSRVTAGGMNFPVPGGMIETAENLRRQYNISRQEQDELALRSHQRAIAAQSEGRFKDEIVPVRVKTRQGDMLIDTDEHPRSDTSMQTLSSLRPVRLDIDREATVTAGNASGQNDGASACIVTTPEMASEFELRPFARLRSWAVAGVAPATMGIGPVPASAKALERADLTLADMDLIELNEAFAAQVLAVTKEWEFNDNDFERLNVNGSGISLGHPIGATGGRILATLLREMGRRGSTFVLETMCIGGGQGLAAIFEAIDQR